MSGIKRCGCELLDLRTGCITIAIMGTIIGAITWILAIIHTTYFLYDDRVILLTTLGVISFALDMATWICLIVGIFRNNAKFILATLIGLVLIIAIRIGVAIFLLTYFGTTNYIFGLDKWVSLIMLIPLPFYIFSFVVVLKFYRTLDGKISVCF